MPARTPAVQEVSNPSRPGDAARFCFTQGDKAGI
jgi:hypothetical protein